MRYAIYFTPPADDPLTRTAAEWLGRDAFGGDLLPHAAVVGLTRDECADHTAAPRRYGFHATLKAPFRLAEDRSEAELFAAFDAFAEQTSPVVIEDLALKRIEGFFALMPRVQSATLTDFAADIVRFFDTFRAPLTESDMARRNPEQLSAKALGYLRQWGYPHVFDAFCFHMTLSGRVPEGDALRVEAALRERFALHLDRPLTIDALALFIEPTPGAPFMVRRFASLGQQDKRKTA